MGLYQLKNVKSCTQRWSHTEANRALLFGGGLALVFIARPNKSVKGTRRPLAVLKFGFLSRFGGFV